MQVYSCCFPPSRENCHNGVIFGKTHRLPDLFWTRTGDGDRTTPLELAFTVEHTSPIATLGNMVNGTSCYASSQGIDAYVGGSIEEKEAALTVDGEPVTAWDSETLKSQRSFSCDLPVAISPHDVLWPFEWSTCARRGKRVRVNEALVRGWLQDLWL